MSKPGMIPSALRRAAWKAQQENRLAWKVMDAHDRSCNGGSKNHSAPPVGTWAKRILKVGLCVSGYHVTLDPLAWRGSHVWLVELDDAPTWEDDKASVSTYRPLGLVHPDYCVDARLWVASSRPNLAEADLRGMGLSRANLAHANLDRARLDHANLYQANLAHANLDHANLYQANLDQARLDHVYLDQANLDHARLYHARLYHVYLDQANLDHANLDGATLGPWERGPDGYARRK